MHEHTHTHTHALTHTPSEQPLCEWAAWAANNSCICPNALMIRLSSGSHLSSPAGVKSTNTCSLSIGSIDRRIGLYTPMWTGLHRDTHSHSIHYHSHHLFFFLPTATALIFLAGKHMVRSLTLTNMSSSDLRRFSSFSISIWHVWQTYRWLTAGPPPYLQGAVHINSHRWNQRHKGNHTATVSTLSNGRCDNVYSLQPVAHSRRVLCMYLL